MSRFKKITKKGKIQKLVETQKPSCFNPVHLWSKYSIIDSIFVSYNLVDQKDEVKNIVVKNLIIVDVQSPENLSMKENK
jgi:hypothetical protein